MIDINYSLRIGYNQALSTPAISIGSGDVEVYYQSLPPDIDAKEYIIIRSITSNDASTFNSSDTTTSIVVEIHTYEEISNSGLNADLIAREVLNRVYPNPQFNLEIDGAQIVDTKLADDRTDNVDMQNGRQYINRFLTFRHLIFQRSDIS